MATLEKGPIENHTLTYTPITSNSIFNLSLELLRKVAYKKIVIQQYNNIKINWTTGTIEILPNTGMIFNSRHYSWKLTLQYSVRAILKWRELENYPWQVKF